MLSSGNKRRKYMYGNLENTYFDLDSQKTKSLCRDTTEPMKFTIKSKGLCAQ